MKATVHYLPDPLARKAFGVYIRRQRESAKVTQAELARRFNYGSPQFISNWERGISQPPAGILFALADALKVHPRDFIKTILRLHTAGSKRQAKAIPTLLQQ